MLIESKFFLLRGDLIWKLYVALKSKQEITKVALCGKTAEKYEGIPVHH